MHSTQMGSLGELQFVWKIQTRFMCCREITKKRMKYTYLIFHVPGAWKEFIYAIKRNSNTEAILAV